MTHESDYEEELSPATINTIDWDVRDGVADPNDIKRLLGYYVRIVERGDDIPTELLEFFKSRFKSFLNEEVRSLDQAIGLVRPRQGRTRADEHEQRMLAAELLASRISGKTHQEALEDVAEAFGCGKTKVGDAWKKRKGEAFPMLRLLRPLNNEDDFTEEELIRVKKLFKKDYEFMKRWFDNER